MLNIILFGAPGCGKGTQAVRIKEKYNINHISTGEVIRGEISRGTELGKSMQEYIEAGKLAPDSIVIGMIRNYMAEHKDAVGNIFDGFPRTTAQAEEFDRILAEDGLSVNVMVYMDVPRRRIRLTSSSSGTSIYTITFTLKPSSAKIRSNSSACAVVRGKPSKMLPTASLCSDI